ncbi:MAG: nitroreductase [Hyphomicrobiaceae bacterium]
MTVEQAIAGRHSVRAFLPQPVPHELIARILSIAGWAPSGSNTQPWKVWVLTGEAKDTLARDLHARHQAGDPGGWEYHYYAKTWREPYLGRRRKTGWGLYGLLGLARNDRDATRRQHGRNFLFFDAPVGLIFTIDRDMELGSWLDYGMFLQSIMIAARSFGLETCPQAAFAQYHEVIQRRLAIPPGQMVVCGMSLGYADPDAKVNTFRTERIALEEFVTWVEELKH